MELKPCPFCGNPPRHLEFKAGYYSERVLCDSCDFYLSPEDWQRRSDDGKSAVLRQQVATLTEHRDMAVKAMTLTVETHDKILPIMNAYMGTLGTTDQWQKTCVASDKLREALAAIQSSEVAK